MPNTLAATIESYEKELSIKRNRLNENMDTVSEITEKKKRANVQSLIRRTRKSIDDLTAKTARLKELASYDWQMNEYGQEAWSDQFRFLNEIDHELPPLPETGEALQRRLWKELPNSRFKRFQEAFCDPKYFCLPHFHLVGTRMVFDEVKDINTLSLAPLIVDLDRVPEALLENLGIATFPPNEKGPVARLEKKAKCIGRLKEIFETTVQLSPENFRLLVIQGQQEPSIEEEVLGAPQRIQGSLLYLRSDEHVKDEDVGKKQYAKRIVQFFPDAYGAQRKTFHEEAVYKKEIGSLAELIVKLENMNRELNNNWKPETDSEVKKDMHTRANALFVECSEALELCENRYKVKARTHLNKIKKHITEDTSVKPNIGAVMASMVGTRNSLERRHNDMRDKSKYNDIDKNTLETEIKSHEFRMSEYAAGVVKIAGRFNANLEIFTEQKGSPETIMKKVTGFLMPINPENLSKVVLAPFAVYAARLREKHDSLASTIALNQEGAKEAAAKILIEMHVIGKFLEVQKVFEQIKEDIIDPRFITVSRIRTFVSDVSTHFNAYQIFPDSIVASYVDAFDEMKKQLQVIENGLRSYEGRDMDLDERTKMYGRLKEFLDTFDIPSIVLNLD